MRYEVTMVLDVPFIFSSVFFSNFIKQHVSVPSGFLCESSLQIFAIQPDHIEMYDAVLTQYLLDQVTKLSDVLKRSNK